MIPRPTVRAELLDALLGPELGARPSCAGSWPLHDLDLDDQAETRAQRDQRHRAAIRVCASCTVRAACADAAAQLDRHTLRGVWAGRVYTSTGRPSPRLTNPDGHPAGGQQHREDRSA